MRSGLQIVLGLCVVVAASVSWGDEAKVTIESLQEEFAKRVIAKVAELGDDVEQDELLEAVIAISEEVYGKHTDVVRAAAKAGLKELPALKAGALEGYEEHERADLGPEAAAKAVFGGIDPRTSSRMAWVTRQWRPGLAAWGAKTRFLVDRLGLEQYVRRITLENMVPVKTFVLKAAKKPTVVLSSLGDYFVVELLLMPKGVWQPTSVRWLKAKKEEAKEE